MGTGSLLKVKRPGRGADHPSLSKCRGQERVGLYLYSPLGLHGLLWEHLKYCVLSGRERGLCVRLITRPEESFRLSCIQCVWYRYLKNGEAMARVGLQCHRKKKNYIGSLSSIKLTQLIPNPLKLKYSALSVQMTSQEIKGLTSISTNNNNSSTPPCPSTLHLSSVYQDCVP